MNTRFLLAVVTLPFLSTVSSQLWCPAIGTTWWHTYSQVGGLSGVVETTYTADTLIDGGSWQCLEAVATYRDLANNGPVITEEWSLHTRLADSTVFLWQGGDQDTLFRFDADVGGTWSVPFSTTPAHSFLVTDRGTRMLDGMEVAWRSVSVLTEDGSVYFLDTLFDRIGFLDVYMIPDVSLNLEPFLAGIRCYSDDELTYQRVPGIACDIGVVVAEETTALPALELWPNPGGDVIHVRIAAAGILTYELTDLCGKVMRTGELRTHNTIDSSALPLGMYTVRMLDAKGHQTTRTWIRQ